MRPQADSDSRQGSSVTSKVIRPTVRLDPVLEIDVDDFECRQWLSWVALGLCPS